MVGCDEVRKKGGDPIGLVRLRLDVDRDDEPVVEIAPGETIRAHLNLRVEFHRW
jgi:hypothetical protein